MVGLLVVVFGLVLWLELGVRVDVRVRVSKLLGSD